MGGVPFPPNSRIGYVTKVRQQDTGPGNAWVIKEEPVHYLSIDDNLA